MRLKFRGREMAHTEIGFEVMKKAIAEIEGMGHAEAEPKLNGRQIHVMITPHPANKRQLKYYTPKAAPAKPEDEPKAKAPAAEEAAS